MIFAKIASAVYVLWGILHVYAAWNVYLMGQNMEPGMVQGRIFQDAWNLLFFALFGIVVAIVYNWKNNKTGYWLNAIVVSMGDIGFILTILLPGYLPLIPGAIGPLLWVIALILSTIAILQKNNDLSLKNSS